MEEQLRQENLLDSLEEKQIIPINSATFEQILQLGLSLDTIYLLEGFSQGTDLSVHTNVAKAQAWKQTLIRKGYIDLNGGITKDGEELLLMVGQGKLLTLKKQKASKRKLIETSFDLWWKAYPSSDTFTYKGKTFRGSRALRVNKDQCIPKLHKILSGDEYTIEEMIRALELEKTQKMEMSVATGQNKMTYFQNSATYLTQRTFEPFIEILRSPESKEIQKVENQVSKRVDI